MIGTILAIAGLVATAIVALPTIIGLGFAFLTWIRLRRSRSSRRVLDEARIAGRRWAPPLSLAILASGDGSAASETISNALHLALPGLEVIAICDGERSAAFPVIVRTFQMKRAFRSYRHELRTSLVRGVYSSAAFPGLFLIDKKEAGPADALNACVNLAANPLFAFIPTDSRLEARALQRLLEEFLHAPEELAAAAAPVRLGGSGLWSVLVEAVRSEQLLPPSHGWAAVAAAAGISGTFVIHRKRLLELAGGFRPDARNPRIDATLRVPAKLRMWGVGGDLRHLGEPVAWEHPGWPLRLLWNRQAGLVESLIRYGWPVIRGSYSRAGRAALWLAFTGVALPVVELLAYLLLAAAFGLQALDPRTLTMAAAVLFGGPMLRAGFATLVEVADRDRFEASYAAARLVGALLSPFVHAIATIGRAFHIVPGLVSGLRSTRRSRYSRGAATVQNPLPVVAPMQPARPPAPPMVPLLVERSSPPGSAVPPPLAPLPLTAPPPIPVAGLGGTKRRDWVVPLAPPPPVHAAAPAPALPPPLPPPPVEVLPPPKIEPLPAPVPLPVPPPKPEPIVPTIVPVAERRPGPITFEVTSTYQIKADAPAGAMPAIQLPSAGGGPIIVTTSQGQIAIPPGQGPQTLPPPNPFPTEPKETKSRRAPRGTSRTNRIRFPGDRNTERQPLPEPDAETARMERPKAESPVENDSDFFLPISDLPDIAEAGGELILSPDETSDRLQPIDPNVARPDRTLDPELHRAKSEPPTIHIPPNALAPAPPRQPEPPDEHRKGSSASWPKVEGGAHFSDPIDLDEGDSSETSSALPIVSDPELSDPLDLGTVNGDSEGYDDATETSSMLPAVDSQSEPLDLDLHDLDAIADNIEKVGSSVALEPVEPGDLKRGLEALSQTTLFAGVRPEERNRIMPFLRSAFIKKGHAVLTEGEPGRGLFIVQNGSFEVVQDEGRRVIATLGSGEAFGEMSLLTGNPASATVRAVEDARLFAITKEDFPALTAAVPWLGVTLARLIAERISRTSLRVVEELKRGLVGRLELIPPASLVQAINVNNQSGTLAVQSGRQSFTAYFEEGQILEGATEDQKNEAAFYEFLAWTSGSFRFEPIRRGKVARSIVTDTVGLLLEGTRRVDEAKASSGTQHVVPQMPAADIDPRREVIAFDLSDERTAVDALLRIPLFSGLRSNQLHEVFEAMQERRAVKGDVIVRQGQLGMALFIVGSGVLDVTTRDDAGVESSLAMFGPGDCFGEIALITGEPTTATVTVMADGKLLVIPRDEFEQVLGRVPAIGANLARILASRLARASRWVSEQAKQGIVGRIESMPTTELIQALHVNSQSGTLHAQAENRTIEMDFLDGQIIDARAADLRGDEAFFKFLAWTKGGFKFQPGRPQGERTVKSDTIGLLFRGIRRIERARESAAAQGRADVDTNDLRKSKSSMLPNVDTGTARELPPDRRAEAERFEGLDPALVPPAQDDEFQSLEPFNVEASLKTIGLSPLFFDAPSPDRIKILPYLRWRRVADRRPVTKLGAIGDALYIVESGHVDEIEVDEAGGERVIESYEHGEPFGEMSFLTEEPATTMFRAVGDVTVLAVVRDDFPKLSADLPWLGTTLARFIAQRLIVASRVKFSEQKKGLLGRLELLPPSAIIQSIHANHQSGVLTARSGDATFTAHLHEGQPFRARTDTLEHEDAVFAFLAWGSGSFRFEPGAIDTRERFIKTDAVSLLLEGNRRLDETKKGSTGSGTRPPAPGTRRTAPKEEVPEIPSLTSPQAAAEQLGKLQLFRGIRPDQLLLIVMLMREVRTAAKDVVIAQGAANPAFYIVADGRYDAMHSDRGEERKVATLTPGDCFGEEAMITGQPSPSAIVSRDKGRLLAIPREQFGPLLGRVPALGASIARILASRLARTSAWMAEQAGGLVGRVEAMPAAEIIQSLNVNRGSGTLAVSHEGKQIEIDFIDGEVQDARIEDLHGEQAFFMVLAWTKGDFTFTPGRPSPKKTVELDTMGLLFRGLRQLERMRTRKAKE